MKLVQTLLVFALSQLSRSQIHTCDTFQVQCIGSRICIPLEWVCDGTNDCPNNSDEENCTDIIELTTKKPSLRNILNLDQEDSLWFKCNSGQTIQKGWKCDGEPDCHDGSDELGCPMKIVESSLECRLFLEFACKDGKKCIPTELVCNAIKDCDDNSDEIKCDSQIHFVTPTLEMTTEATTPPIVDTKAIKSKCRIQSQYMCRDGKRCIPQTWICDGSPDCHDGSDELGCLSSTTSTSTTSTSTTSTSTQVSTEADSSESLLNCITSGGFLCHNGENCISTARKCNGIPDCPDDSDEVECHNNSNFIHEGLEMTCELKCTKKP